MMKIAANKNRRRRSWSAFLWRLLPFSQTRWQSWLASFDGIKPLGLSSTPELLSCSTRRSTKLLHRFGRATCSVDANSKVKWKINFSDLSAYENENLSSSLVSDSEISDEFDNDTVHCLYCRGYSLDIPSDRWIQCRGKWQRWSHWNSVQGWTKQHISANYAINENIENLFE